MEFFNKLGQKATEAYKVTADKTSKLAKETKLRMQIGDYKSQVNDLYKEIGEAIYQDRNVNDDIIEKCKKIDELKEKIETNTQECLKLKNKRRCPNCGTEIDKTVQFCPKCGAKQEIEPEENVEENSATENPETEATEETKKEAEDEEPAKEVEIVDDAENNDEQ